MGNDPLNMTGTEHKVLITLCGLGEAHGLQIVQGSEGALKRSSIYVLLNRLEDKGFIESRYIDAPVGARGPRRRMYRVTGAGQKVLRAWELAAAATAGALVPA